MSDDLVAFLRARLDEVEFRAREGLGWQTGSRYEGQPQGWVDYLRTAGNPQFVLAQVAAGRAILELHKPDRDPADQWYGHDVRCEECGGITGSAAIGERGFQRSWPCATLRHFAAVYSDHPDYQEQWKP